MFGTTVENAFELALQHHQAGQLNEAESIYRQILLRDPRHVDTLHHLGVIALQAGKHDSAVDLIRQAIVLQRNYPAAHNNLGIALYQKGQLDEAIAVYRQAITLRPDYPEAHGNLGNALKDLGHLQDAIVAYRQAIRLRPGYADAHKNLVTTLRDMGRLNEAIAACRQMIALNFDSPDLQVNLGILLYEQGQLDEAIAAFRRGIALHPGHPSAHNHLGLALHDGGQLDEAIASYQRAIALRPDFPEALNNLGKAFFGKRQFEEAAVAYRQAIALQPEYGPPYNNLANIFKEKGQLDEALNAYGRALELNPEDPRIHVNLGNVLKETAQLDEALAAYGKALALKPEFPLAHSNLIWCMNFHTGSDALAIAEENRRWNQRHAEPLRTCIEPHTNDRTAMRRLRVGYVSSDFREHVIGYIMLPLLAHHNPEELDVFCYADGVNADPVTARMKQCAGHWRNITGLSDAQVADLVRKDEIDILVDLAVHTANNRLLVFARKPAPVQVTFAGYPGSTGLDLIDYRLSDRYLDPPGMDEAIYSEKTVRLPHSFWCYDPWDSRDFPVSSLPASANGWVTFGSLNNFCKVNDPLLRLWAGVLRAVPSSRLLLLAPEGRHRQHLLEMFRQEDIAIERIELVAKQPRRKYLELYHRIDLCLDPLPYNGHSTSLDSLWMGVPVVTLVGQTIVGRAGLSQLMNLELPELVARTPEEYVRIAAGLAADLPRLAQLRSTLRERMERSPLLDGAGFAHDFEVAYREMWRKWCDPTNSPCRASAESSPK